METPNIKYCPIFQQADLRFIIPHENFWAPTEQEAYFIAIGSIPESVVFGFSFTGEILKVENDSLPHYSGSLGPFSVAVLIDEESSERVKKHLNPESSNGEVEK